MARNMPAEGAAAPAFSVPAHDGSTVSLDQFHGRSHLVLFFFPKANTPG
jgi:peroxiredoxin Q/BCP